MSVLISVNFTCLGKKARPYVVKGRPYWFLHHNLSGIRSVSPTVRVEWSIDLVLRERIIFYWCSCRNWV